MKDSQSRNIIQISTTFKKKRLCQAIGHRKLVDKLLKQWLELIEDSAIVFNLQIVCASYGQAVFERRPSTTRDRNTCLEMNIDMSIVQLGRENQ